MVLGNITSDAYFTYESKRGEVTPTIDGRNGNANDHSNNGNPTTGGSGQTPGSNSTSSSSNSTWNANQSNSRTTYLIQTPYEEVEVKSW